MPLASYHLCWVDRYPSVAATKVHRPPSQIDPYRIRGDLQEAMQDYRESHFQNGSNQEEVSIVVRSYCKVVKSQTEYLYLTHYVVAFRSCDLTEQRGYSNVGNWISLLGKSVEREDTLGFPITKTRHVYHLLRAMP
jgi:hypothetical protein